MKRSMLLVLTALLVASVLLSACAAQPATVVVTKEVEKIVTQEVEKVVTKEVQVEVTATPAPADQNTLPRNETMYFNGQQWGPVVGWNPYSGSNNNAMTIAQQDNARVTMFETPYLYDMLDGKQY